VRDNTTTIDELLALLDDDPPEAYGIATDVVPKILEAAADYFYSRMRSIRHSRR
jgi:hypothetical protein